MTHYNFIHNESQVKQFYDLFYKDTFTSPDLVYMILKYFFTFSYVNFTVIYILNSNYFD